MIIGMTGHQNLPEAAQAFADEHLRALLDAQTAPISGLCSLAEGADQLFAQLILAAGGSLHAVIPSRHYDTTFNGSGLACYHNLLASATRVTELDFAEPGEQAYHAAGRYVVEHCDLLVAIWDGHPARGLGGTADAVAHARELGRDVQIIWPKGVRRG